MFAQRVYVFIFLIFISEMAAQQINIPRIEQMPRQPSPYLMRDWKAVALGYDSLVFNPDLTGEYLPLIWFYDNTVNYPEHGSFGLNTVVGTTRIHSAEAINVLPAVISASLCGIDKSSRDGKNFVLMCEEFFNKRADENVYLNAPVASSGNDWWYETMPNVFFYQLYDLYRNTGHFNSQFVTVADRWLEAVKHMGGSSTPWNLPDMNHRAWSLSDMKPNNNGVKEPEAAGAIAWILYSAYLETGNEKYRIGAEWCLEFLNSLSSNPSYELQLGYGVLTAARMNAELGTNYNVQKMINWCFDLGQLRNWGAIVGNWNGYDVSGLIGELNENNYAFVMNTFELAGALVPLVRYDTRYARAIGKWMLNAANAARLFYPKFLPPENQDSYEWANRYDPESVIAHEALRQEKNGKSPFATGDAVSGGWGLTNLTLYSSSHAGIFGGIIDTTNVEKILKLDLTKTDYFSSSYPSFLFYNPYDETKTVGLNTGSGTYDIYDAVSSVFIKNGISGKISLDIPADAAVVAVIIPSGGVVTYDNNRMLVNGKIVDFELGEAAANNAPRIKSLSAGKTILVIPDSTGIFCTAEDKDKDQLVYTWNASAGSINSSGPQAVYKTPSTPGLYSVICMVSDTKGGSNADTLILDVRTSINHPPVFNYIKAYPKKIDINSYTIIKCSVTDEDQDTLTYTWSSAEGEFSGHGSEVQWRSPALPGNYYVTCTVYDGSETVSDSILVIVRDFSILPSGNLLLYLPFTGNVNDESGSGNITFLYEAAPSADRFNHSANAYSFDGYNDYIQVRNSSLLNFREGITINFWMKIKTFYEREEYPLSHGNWENRWKISITDKKLRWTVKTDKGIKDLDSDTGLKADTLYNITVTYSQPDMEIYINGELDAYTSFSGLINQTSLDLMVGQALPGSTSYGFNGTLDEIRLYNYLLPVSTIKSFYDIPTFVTGKETLPSVYTLEQNYPNPFNPSTMIQYSLPADVFVTIKIFNILGEQKAILVNGIKHAGVHSVSFDAAGLPSGVYFYKLTAGNFSQTKKMILMR